MKITKSKAFFSIMAIAILLVSLAVTLVDAIVPLHFWIHPILNFLFCTFSGFGVLSLAFGFKNKSPWFIFVGAILLGLAIYYALVQYLTWWLPIIIVGVMWILLAIIDVMLFGSKTEEVDNAEGSDYKDYKQRRAEKLESEQNKEPEELPEIKSFK